MSEATSVPSGKMEDLNVRSVKEMTNAPMRIEVNENLASAKNKEAGTAKKVVEHSVHLDATTSEHSMLATDSGNSADVKTIVVVKGRSSPIDPGGKTGHKNSLTGHATIVELPQFDPHSKIVVAHVKVLEPQNDPAIDEKVSVPDQSPRNSKKVAQASAGLNALAEVISDDQTTLHAAEVPDTLSSSFCPS